jgi:hypothetical protein
MSIVAHIVSLGLFLRALIAIMIWLSFKEDSIFVGRGK